MHIVYLDSKKPCYTLLEFIKKGVVKVLLNFIVPFDLRFEFKNYRAYPTWGLAHKASVSASAIGRLKIVLKAY